jgi:hypothetical protein
LNEKWIRWEFKEGLEKKYDIDMLENIDNKLLVNLSDANNDKKLNLKWDGSMEFYIYSYEVARSKLCENLDVMEWTFFKIENSKYLKWIKENFAKIYENKELYHFCIVGINFVLDIVACDYPIIIDIN